MIKRPRWVLEWNHLSRWNQLCLATSQMKAFDLPFYFHPLAGPKVTNTSIKLRLISLSKVWYHGIILFQKKKNGQLLYGIKRFYLWAGRNLSTYFQQNSRIRTLRYRLYSRLLPTPFIFFSVGQHLKNPDKVRCPHHFSFKQN